MPLIRYYENTDSASRPPDKEGFNISFEVYRYRGPKKLGVIQTKPGQACSLVIQTKPGQARRLEQLHSK